MEPEPSPTPSTRWSSRASLRADGFTRSARKATPGSIVVTEPLRASSSSCHHGRASQNRLRLCPLAQPSSPSTNRAGRCSRTVTADCSLSIAPGTWIPGWPCAGPIFSGTGSDSRSLRSSLARLLLRIYLQCADRTDNRTLVCLDEGTKPATGIRGQGSRAVSEMRCLRASVNRWCSTPFGIDEGMPAPPPGLSSVPRGLRFR